MEIDIDHYPAPDIACRYKGDSGKSRQQNPELDIFENNKPVDFKGLVDPVISRYLKKSDSAPPKPNFQAPQSKPGNAFQRSIAAKRAHV